MLFLFVWPSTRRSLLYREVNDRIYELVEGDPELTGELLCECGRDCGWRVELLPAAFATLRETVGIVRSRDCRRVRPRRPRPAGGVPALS